MDGVDVGVSHLIILVLAALGCCRINQPISPSSSSPPWWTLEHCPASSVFVVMTNRWGQFSCFPALRVGTSTPPQPVPHFFRLVRYSSVHRTRTILSSIARHTFAHPSNVYLPAVARCQVGQWFLLRARALMGLLVPLRPSWLWEGPYFLITKRSNRAQPLRWMPGGLVVGAEMLLESFRGRGLESFGCNQLSSTCPSCVAWGIAGLG